jgi:hypothetical protein
MDNSRRWSRQQAVRHPEDLTTAPTFVDTHISNHLSEEQASWHGPNRSWVAAASIAVIAGVAMLAAFSIWDLSTPAEPSGGSSVGGHDPGAAAQPGSPQSPADPGVGSILNSTTQSLTPSP